MAPPTETTMLANYLLVPAQLPAIISLQEFTALFPRAQQPSPRIRTLYRDLQAQRNALADAVAASIADEARRGKALRREIARARRDEAAALAGDDAEVDMERALFGAASGARPLRHDLSSIVPELDASAEALEAAVRSLEREEAELLQEIRQTVGGMSDLRYGKFSNGQLGEQVVAGLQTVRETCETKRV